MHAILPDSLPGRFADDADDAALRERARSVTMEGGVAYTLEREPSYFALSRLQGEPVIAVVDGAAGVDATAAVAFRSERVGGAAVPTAYCGDARVRPGLRRSGRLHGLLAMLAGEIDRRETAAAYGLVLAGNERMQAVFAHTRTARSQGVARIRNRTILCDAPMPAPTLPVRRARRADLAAMADLWSRAHAERELVPVRDEPTLSRLLGVDGPPALPGATIDAVHVVERGGRLTGFALPWDATPVKQLRLRALPPALRALRATHGAIARRAGRPVIPADGQLVPFRYLASPCAETAADFAALLSSVVLAARRDGVLYVDVALDVRDPLMPALGAAWGPRVDFDLVSIVTPGMRPRLVSSRPCFCDMALV